MPGRPEEEIPQRFAARGPRSSRGSSGASSSGSGTRRRKPNAIATHRELQAVDPDALSDEELIEYLGALPRPPLGDDHPAHALHGERGRADRRLPRPCRRLDRPAAGRAARPDARRLAGVGGRVGRARAADRRDRGPTPHARELLASDGDPGAMLEALRSLDSEAGAAMSGYLDLVGNRLLDGFDISEPDRARAARRAAARDPDRRRGQEPGRDRTSRQRIADVRAKVPEEHQDEFDELLGEARLTLPAARRARRLQRHLGLGNHAPRRARGRPPARGREGGSTSPATSSTPASTRCARCSRRRAAPSADELAAPRRVPRRRTAPRTRRRRSARRLRRRRIRPGCRPASARLMRATGIALGVAVRQLRGGARGAPAARPRGEPRRLRGDGAARLRPGRLRPDRQGRRARHEVDDRGVQHPAAAARRDRDRQRRPALALGDRRARVRHPGRRRDARGARSGSPTAHACASTATPAR